MKNLTGGLSAEECVACSFSLKAVVFRSVDVDLRKGLPSLH